jgi:hypothetical protein
VEPISIDGLWAALVDDVDLDFINGEATLRLHAIDDGRQTDYVLSCRGVTAFDLKRRDPDSWDIAEVTEAWIEPTPTGVELLRVFWDEDFATLRVTAAEVMLDGRSLRAHSGTLA